MKRIVAAIGGLVLFAALAFGATLSPISLLNPAGSTAGQSILSTGPSTAPVWGTAGSGVYAPLASPALTGTPTAPTASNGNNTTQIATTAFVRTLLASPAPIGNTAQSSGQFTMLSASGLFTPSAGIKATTTGTNPAAGNVGTLLSSTGSTIAATSGTQLNGASVALPAGNWNVTGFCQTNPTAGTFTNSVVAALSTASATYQTVATGITSWNIIAGLQQPAGGIPLTISAPGRRFNSTGSTTAYLVCQAGFSVSTLTISGYIQAEMVP